jgi:hypothetical protein
MAGLIQKGLCFNKLVLCNNGADLDLEMLYAESVPVGNGVLC